MKKIVTGISESSPTDQVQDGATTADVLELGKLLASELEQADTLGRWMAHYLAEQMVSLRQKSGSARAIAETEVAGLVLRLWALRRHLPVGRPPLAEVDNVEAAIARLAPGRQPWAYFGAFSTDTEPSPEETEKCTMLKTALLIDSIAGDLVHGLIGRGAELAEEGEAAWIAHAEQVGDGALRAIRRLRFAGDDSEDATDWNSEVRRRATALSSVVSALTAALEDETSEPPGST